jgi:hypothetical protein
MHYLYLVAVDKKIEGEDKIAYVEQTLSNNNFAGEGGFWGGNKADWFVMGGRWSGFLQEIKLKGFNEKAKAILTQGKENKDFISTEEVETHAKELQDLWESLGGKGVNTWARDSYKSVGLEDDTMTLDKELYNALKERFTKPNEYGDETEIAIIDEDGCVGEEMILRDFLKDESVIDKYDLVVVDYHN